jgi:cell filamentation protein
MFLKELHGSKLVCRLAYYMSEINAIHPFREGNGRAQREFIRELALQNDVIIHYESVTAEQMINASIESFNGNYGPMEDLLKNCIAY